jgi:putative FmdB family regulatory protein
VPIYEYLCEACGRISEVMQKVSDPAPRSCSECGARKLAKLVSRSAFQLKGGGWYSDLYASRKGAKKDETAATPPAAGAPAAGAAGEARTGASSSDAGKSAAAESGGTAAAPTAAPSAIGSKKRRSGKAGS